MIIGSLLLIFAAVVMLAFGLPARSDPLLIGSIVATLFAVIVLIGSARRTAALRIAAGADGPVGDGPVGDGRTSGGPPRAATVRPEAVRPEAVRPEAVRSRRPAGEQSVHRPAGGSAGGGAVIEGSVVEEPVTTRATPPGPATSVAGSQATATERTATDRPVVGPTEAGGTGGEATIPSQTRPTIDLNARPSASAHTDDGDDYADGEFSDEDPPGEPPPQLVSAADTELVATMHATVLVIDGRPRYHRAGCAHLRGRPTEPLPVSEAVELGFTPCSRCEPDTALIGGARPS